jgi:hypothetical protein
MEDKVSANLSQTGFAAHLVEDINAHFHSVMPDATPYCSDLPINAIPESDKDENCPMFVDCKQKYQSMVGSIWWLANTTQPDLAACHSFLSAYNNKPSQSHWNAALYVLHYIHSTINYGIKFMSKESPALHTYMLYPHASDIGAYTDALPPTPDQHHLLTTYSNACWGSQLSNAVQEGIQLPLFKFRSMSRAIVMRSRGPISWKAEQQEWTSLSLCEAEIQATDTGLRLTVNTHNMISSLLSLGYPTHITDMATPLYNDNDTCVKWCHNITTKGNRHIENHKNTVCELVFDGTLTILHVNSKTNIADIFTKEMRNGTNFYRLCDSLMCHLSDYNRRVHISIESPSPVLAQMAYYIAPPHPSLLKVLASHVSFCIPVAISCLLASGRHILSCITSSLPLQALMSDPMGGVVT